MDRAQIFRMIAYHNRMREQLLKDNDRFLDESVKYKTELHLYEHNPSDSIARQHKESLARRAHDYYHEQLKSNNHLLDELEPDMQRWVDQIAPEMPLDVFIQEYAKELELELD